MKSPFKFLDSYTKNDRDIFFGRDREIEELYHRVFESKMMLVYGVSGTGKSSLIHCGLANKFQETDWLPLIIRRGGNIINSMAGVIKAASITTQEGQLSTPAHFRKAVKSLYLDHYKPVFFIFDQFEELFIFGDKEERKSFVQIIKSLIESDLQCRLIFVMREEYMAGVTEFERYIPTFFSNRVRIEKMSHVNALEAIKESCKVFDISLEDGFAEILLEKLSPDAADVELTYLQVFLDRIFRLAAYPTLTGRELKEGYSETQGGVSFNISHLSRVGNVSDLLGSFLDEQISLLEDPATGLSILKSFVSLKGTRKQLSEEEILESLKTFGKEIPSGILREYLQQFINLRILKDKNEAGNFELRHDSLADKIYGKITMMEKELLEVMNFLETSYQQFEKRGSFLSEEDLKYIQYFEDKLILQNNSKFVSIIEVSKKYHSGKKRKRRQIVISLTAIVIIMLSILSIWAINQRSTAISQKNIAEIQKNQAVQAKQEAQKSKDEADKAREEAEIQRTRAEANAKEANEQKYRAENARQIAENELYINIKNSLSVSAEKMNVLYYGITNPVRIAVSGIPDKRITAKIDAGEITKGDFMDLKNIFLATPGRIGQVRVTVYGEIKSGQRDSIGSKTFRVKSLPDPYASFAGRTGGIILKETALETKMMEAKLDVDFDLKFKINGFNISMEENGSLMTQNSSNNYLTPDQLSLIQRIKHGNKLYFEKITGLNPDGMSREFPSLYFTVWDYRSIIESGNNVLMHKTAMDFYHEGMSIKDFQKRMPFMQDALKIFNALEEKTADDLFDELIVLSQGYADQALFNLSFRKEYEERINNIEKQIISCDWKSTFIDTAFSLENKITPLLTGNIFLNKNLGIYDFLIQLSDTLLGDINIHKDQKSAIINIDISISKLLLIFNEYEKSRQLILSSLNIDSTNVELKFLLLGLYEILQNKFPNDALKNKIDNLNKELSVINDPNGLLKGAEYFIYRGQIAASRKDRISFFKRSVLLYERIMKEFPEKDVAEGASNLYNNLSYDLLFNGQFVEALDFAGKGIALTSDDDILYTKLALGYLFNGRYDEALIIIESHKDKTVNNVTFNHYILTKLDELEKAGITNDDARRLQNKLKE